MINRFSAPLLALAVALPVSGIAQTNTWELGHPDAKLLMGIDLKGLRDSAAWQAFQEQLKAHPFPPPANGTQGAILGFAGQMLNDVDRILISSPASKTATSTANPPFLIALEGTLPLPQLLAFLPGTSHRYHEVDVFRGTKATDASIAMLDTRTIVMGDEKSVLTAIDRRGHSLPPASALMKRAQALASTHEFWVIAEDSLSKFQPAGAGLTNPMAAQIASQVKGIDMGLSVHDGFQFEMSLATESEAAAAQMSQLLSSQISLAMVSQANHAQAAEMAKRLHVDTEGTHMRLSFALTAEEFAQQLQTAQAALAARSSEPAAQPVKPQPKPATPGKVRIYGLDEGVREIQLTH
jgi:hypothetical protein